MIQLYVIHLNRGKNLKRRYYYIFQTGGVEDFCASTLGNYIISQFNVFWGVNKVNRCRCRLLNCCVVFRHLAKIEARLRIWYFQIGEAVTDQILNGVTFRGYSATSWFVMRLILPDAMNTQSDGEEIILNYPSCFKPGSIRLPHKTALNLAPICTRGPDLK